MIFIMNNIENYEVFVVFVKNQINRKIFFKNSLKENIFSRQYFIILLYYILLFNC